MGAETTDRTDDVIAGSVERVTFHNPENGFCVLRVTGRGHRDLITVVGHTAAISAGEWVNATGSWINDRTHGLQFRARFLTAAAPTTLDGVHRRKASRLIGAATYWPAVILPDHTVAPIPEGDRPATKVTGLVSAQSGITGNIMRTYIRAHERLGHVPTQSRL